MKIKEILKITGIPVFFASLCCVSPIILVLFGLGSVTYATTLGEVLYGEYKWVFRSLGLILLSISVIYYLITEKGICTLDQAKRKRNEIINIIMVSLIVAVLLYIVWLYGAVHIFGGLLGIWAI